MLPTQSASPDSLRNKLEEIFKMMLMVWAKQGIALSTLTGLKNGTTTKTLFAFLILVFINRFDKLKQFV